MQAFFMTLEDYLVEHPKVRTAWSTPNGLKLNSLNLPDQPSRDRLAFITYPTDTRLFHADIDDRHYPLDTLQCLCGRARLGEQLLQDHLFPRAIFLTEGPDLHDRSSLRHRCRCGCTDWTTARRVGPETQKLSWCRRSVRDGFRPTRARVAYSCTMTRMASGESCRGWITSRCSVD
jgi:hypothetical protein